jgi:hypothetical protein
MNLGILLKSSGAVDQEGEQQMGKGQSSLRGRNAGSGRFIPVSSARARPTTATVERVPKPGYGAASSSPRGRDASSGEFIPIAEARRRPATTVIERVPNPGKQRR